LELDPLVAVIDPRKPLLSKLLAVPALRTRYLQYVRQVTEESLDWSKLRPLVGQYWTLIDREVQADTRKLESYAAFQAGTGLTSATVAEPPTQGFGRRHVNLREFVEKRRAYLLRHPEVVKVSRKQ
jgi:hypothetical protein